jgi:hypothetical protein
MGDQPGAEPHQRPLRKRRGRMVHAVGHQLPAAVHHQRLQRLVVAGAGVGLQDRHDPQQRRRHRRLPLGPVVVHPGQLGLERLVEQLMAVLAQPNKQPGPADPFHHFPLQPRRLHRRLPCLWTHHPPPDRAGPPTARPQARKPTRTGYLTGSLAPLLPPTQPRRGDCWRDQPADPQRHAVSDAQLGSPGGSARAVWAMPDGLQAICALADRPDLGRRSRPACGPRPMLPASWTGRSRSTPAWSGPTRTSLGPAKGSPVRPGAGLRPPRGRRSRPGG